MFNVISPDGSSQLKSDQSPSVCPFCHKSIIPLAITFLRVKSDATVLFQCPNNTCNKAFLGYFSIHIDKVYFNGITSFGTPVKKKFSEGIGEISPSFTEIYNEAFFAEQHNLTEICGVGYRKALEFLIKDYAILSNKDKEEHIKQIQLGPCINTYVNDTRVKKVAERAVWLGNDETHYVKKWEGKNLDDLKKLIVLTVHWIEMELLTEEYEDSMPKHAK